MKTEVWSRNRVPELILGYARGMRKNPTQAEELLWQELRGRKLNNLKFRRQQHMKGYILDFYCDAVRLGVEVDGAIHLQEKQIKYDADRSNHLAEYGIKIIRFKNEEVLEHMSDVLNSIVDESIKRIR